MRLTAELRDDLAWEYVANALDGMIVPAAAGLSGGPDPRGVRELHVELTHRCNLKCVMCEHWPLETTDPGSVGRELSLDELKRSLDGSRTVEDVENVVVTGGEPWLRADFVDVIAWLSRRFPRAAIIALTNFWNTGHMRRKLGELAARGVKNLRLGSSLDGLEAVHDEIRGQAGAFAGLARTAKALRAEFPDVPFGFTFTILPRNAGELLATYEYVRDELGSSLGAQWVVETPGIEPIRWTPEAKAEALAQVRRVGADLCRRHGALEKLRGPDRAAHGWLWSELLYWRWLEEYGRRARRFEFFRRCTAGERHVMIGAEGEVFFCPVNRAREIGRLRDGPLDALWNGPRAEDERRFVDSGQCHCWLRCVSQPALDRLVARAAP